MKRPPTEAASLMKKPKKKENHDHDPEYELNAFLLALILGIGLPPFSFPVLIQLRRPLT
jgi:hypothetical protein